MFSLLLSLTAQATDQPLGRDPLVFRGRQAEAEVVVRGPSEGPVTLQLDLAASQRVDPEHSWLTVSMDGVPVRSAALEQLYQAGTEGQWTLTLPPLAEGFHTLSLQSSLWTEDDPCLLRDPESAWLRVDPSSQVSWTPKTLTGTLPSLVEDWQALGEPVSLVLPKEPSPAGVAALLAAQGRLGEWGLESTLEAGPARFLLMEAEGSRSDAALWPEALLILAENPAAQAVLDRSGDSLRIMTRTPENWAKAIQGLDPVTLERCSTTPCVLGPLPTATERDPASTFTPGTTLKDLGLTRGAVFLGEGAHTLRLPFGQPANSVLTEAPVVDLRVKLPQDLPLEASSTASLWLGDRPLETWALDNGEQRLVARIPEYAWTDGVWDLRLELRLDPENESCHAIDPKHTWIEVLPESGTLLTLEESVYAGISGFERATRSEAATLYFNPTLSWQQWALAGYLLSTLPLHLQPVADIAACQAPCVSPETATLQAPGAYDLYREAAWADPSAEAGLPLSATVGQAAMRASGCQDDGLCETLTLFLPKRPLLPELAPNLASLNGHNAVWDGSAWVSLAEDASPALTLARADAGPQTELVPAVSENEAKLGQLDMAMLASLLLVALVGGLWVYRNGSRSELDGPVDIEVT